MARCRQLLLFSAWLLLLRCGQVVRALRFSRADFPENFAFGAGTAAYQYEGATADDDRSPTIWDTYAHSGRNEHEGTGDIASDGYHKYKEDVKLMSDMGLEAYRFTISWSRLIPGGRGVVNPKGLQFYNNVINELTTQMGIIGLNMFYLFTDSAEDVDATERAKSFLYGWILHPLVFGDYPETMSEVAGSRLPSFSINESELVINAFDFIGVNHYTSVYVSNNADDVEGTLHDFTADMAILLRGTKSDPPTAELRPGKMIDPQGLELVIDYVREGRGSGKRAHLFVPQSLCDD